MNDNLRYGIQMRKIFRSIVLLIAAFASGPVCSQEANVLPKYGSAQRSPAQQAADQQFINDMDKEYKGDLKRASGDVASRGRDALVKGNVNAAMLSFNQAWLLDKTNGRALWGMASIQAGSGKSVEALALFAEAEPLISSDIDFSIDYARTLGIAGAQTRNDAQLREAFRRFAQIHGKAPQHVLNLQNWAITLFYTGNYADAWNKIKLAEAAPRRGDLDLNFIRALQGKMPRP